MSSYRWAYCLLLACISLVNGEGVQPSLAGSRPNIIVVMTDDQGYGDLGCHGHPVLRTPHLDQFASESLRFTQFFVSPTCSPTRAAMLTGRHEFKSGVTHTINERERLDLNAVTFSSQLQKAGYRTGIFGKWHLGDEEAYQPADRGFDEVFIHGAGGIGQSFPGSCGDVPNNKYFDPTIRHNGRFVETKGYCTDIFFAQAMDWIGQQADGTSPFFALITPNAPHAPLISPGPAYDAMYQGKSIGGKVLSKEAVAYFAMITNIDDNVGRLVRLLDEKALATKTLVLFLNDNGGTFNPLYSAGMRGGKGTPYEGGTRVTSFWRWKGRLVAGTDVRELAAHIDLFPTFLKLAGVPFDASRIDGISLLPLLEDPTASLPDRFLFTHVGRWEKGKADDHKYRSCAVRSKRFRLVNNSELYDLQADPGEQQNVMDRFPEEVRAMRQAYEQWWMQARAGMVNEEAVGPKVNPFKEAYERQRVEDQGRVKGATPPLIRSARRGSPARRFSARRRCAARRGRNLPGGLL